LTEEKKPTPTDLVGRNLIRSKLIEEESRQTSQESHAEEAHRRAEAARLDFARRGNPIERNFAEETADGELQPDGSREKYPRLASAPA